MLYKYDSTNTKLKLSVTYGTSVGELVKLSGRESRGDAGSNPVGVSIKLKLHSNKLNLYNTQFC